MKKNWDKYLQESVDHMDCRYGKIKLADTDKFEHECWRAWSSGRDALDFVDEYMRDRKPDYEPA